MSETLQASFSQLAKDDDMTKFLWIEESGESIIVCLAGLGKKSLLIFDNAEGMANTVAKYLIPAYSLDVLITSRNPDLQ
jgi:hypothetical protein